MAASITNTTSSNDGGIILTLFFMATIISYFVFTAIGIYEGQQSNASKASWLRKLSGLSNLGNAITHILLIIYTISNYENNSNYWLEERKLGGIEGLVALTIINSISSLCALYFKYMTFPLVWNTFVAFVGTLIPLVWLRFVSVGMSSWPYEVVFMWFMIFYMELCAVTSSVTQFLLGNNGNKTKTK